MNNTSLLDILNSLGQDYVLIKKWVDFPELIDGSDVDLLVIDLHHSSEKLQSFFIKNLINQKNFLRVIDNTNHVFLDYFENNQFILRLDLIDNLDIFSKFSIQNALKIKIFMSRIKINIDGYSVFLPSNEFDLLIRYLEYLEWFQLRPDKIRHLEYILETAGESDIKMLTTNIHKYVRYNHQEWKNQFRNDPKVFSSRKHAIEEIFRLSKFILQQTIKKISRFK